MIKIYFSKPTSNFIPASNDAAGGVDDAATFVAMYQMTLDLDFKMGEKKSGSSIVSSLNVYKKINSLRNQKALMIERFSNNKFSFSILAYYASEKSKSLTYLGCKNDKGEDDIFETYYGIDEQFYVNYENSETLLALSYIYIIFI